MRWPGRVAVLVACAALAACDPRALRYAPGGAVGCDDGTVSVEVTLDDVAAMAMTLTARIAVFGGGEAVTDVAHTPGETSATIAARLPAGYRSGDPATLTVTAVGPGGAPLGGGSGPLVVAGTCPSPVMVAVGARAQYEFRAPPSRKLDLLVVIDTSSGMQSFQAALLAQFPVFMNVLKMLPTGDGTMTGLPDLHLGVISSNTGPGRYDLPGRNCPFGGDRGRLEVAPRGSCAVSPFVTVPPSPAFLVAANNQQQTNYRGDIADAFNCIAALGDRGCAFSSPLEAVRWGLDPLNPVAGNQGFLREDALLMILLLTRQDDCSVPPDSALMDPAQDAMSDPLGPFSTFRCNEFGHLCQQDGALRPPPRGPVPLLGGCVSNDTDTGRLTKVADEVAFLRGLKTDPSRIFVAALTGPVNPYIIEQQFLVNRLGISEYQPQVLQSCGTDANDRALPAVRLQQWVAAFGVRGAAQSICANTFAPALSSAATMLSTLVAQCIAPTLRDADPTTPALDPDCVVTDHVRGAPPMSIPACAANGGAPPCWKLTANSTCAPQLSFFITRAIEPSSDLVTGVSCASCPPGIHVAGCP